MILVFLRPMSPNLCQRKQKLREIKSIGRDHTASPAIHLLQSLGILIKPQKLPSYIFINLSFYLIQNIVQDSFIAGLSSSSEVKAPACNAGDLGSIPGSGRFPGEGNGNPLQYSCLENPMDGGAWWATGHGVTKSRTQLSDFTRN